MAILVNPTRKAPVYIPSGGTAAWGGITGTLSAQTDLQSVLDNKATGTGTANGTNTGNNATNTQYSGLATSKQDVNQSCSPGSFTVATETWRIQGRRIALTTTQRITLAGTGRLRVSN